MSCVVFLSSALLHISSTQKRKKEKRSYFASYLIFRHFSRFNCFVSFCSLTKGITPKNCRLCVGVLINKRSLDPFVCLDLVLNARE